MSSRRARTARPLSIAAFAPQRAPSASADEPPCVPDGTALPSAPRQPAAQPPAPRRAPGRDDAARGLRAPLSLSLLVCRVARAVGGAFGHQPPRGAPSRARSGGTLIVEPSHAPARVVVTSRGLSSRFDLGAGDARANRRTRGRRCPTKPQRPVRQVQTRTLAFRHANRDAARSQGGLAWPPSAALDPQPHSPRRRRCGGRERARSAASRRQRPCRTRDAAHSSGRRRAAPTDERVATPRSWMRWQAEANVLRGTQTRAPPSAACASTTANIPDRRRRARATLIQRRAVS